MWSWLRLLTGSLKPWKPTGWLSIEGGAGGGKAKPENAAEPLRFNRGIRQDCKLRGMTEESIRRYVSSLKIL